MLRIRQLFIELRRRRVFRVAGLYVVGSWVVLQVADLAFQSFGLPGESLRWIWYAALVGFPLAMIFGWRYDITADGVVRTPPLQSEKTPDLGLKRADYVILSLLMMVALAVVFSFTGKIGQEQPAPLTQQANAIAVLPLDNQSGEAEQAYFVTGMHDALIAGLVRISGLKVISRLSTEAYRDRRKTATEIGSELGVDYLVEGSVLRDEDRVRITVQLIDAADGSHLWSESYERTLANVLELQSAIARDVARQVAVTLSPAEEALLAEQRVVDPEAFELYLKGRFHWYRFTPEDLALALEYFQQSIDRDPEYALAYVGFADALATPAHAGMMPTTQVFPAAKQFVERALELDPDLAEAHDMLARINFAYEWDWAAAERGFRKAIGLKPGYPDVHVVYAQYLSIMDRPEEALEEARIGADLDPLNPWFQIEYLQRLAWQGDYESTREAIQGLIARHPDIPTLHEYLWDLAAVAGEYATALEAAQRYFELQGEPDAAELLTGAETESDYRSQMAAASEWLERNAQQPYISRVSLARVRMHAGDVERTQDLLDEALVMRDSQLGYTTINPLFAPLWNTPRYRDLRRAMNL